MGSWLEALDRLLPDAPPALVFEVGDGVLYGARRAGQAVQARTQRVFTSTAVGDPDGATAIIDDMLQELQPVPAPDVAVLLSDTDSRLAVIELDSLPRRGRERVAAVAERLGDGLPFDPRTARIAFRQQSNGAPVRVLATAVSTRAVSAWEDPFDRVGLLPKYVGLATAEALNLIQDPEMVLAVRLGPQLMTMAAVEKRSVLMVRQIPRPVERTTEDGDPVDEILSDLFPTLAYVEERFERPVTGVRVSAPEHLLRQLLDVLPTTMDHPVAPLSDSVADAVGLEGYIHG